MKSIAVFNNKGGGGKTSVVYHLAWMYANLDYNVVVADLDPQANITSMFLEDDDWSDCGATIGPTEPSTPRYARCWRGPATSPSHRSHGRRRASH